MIDAKIERMIGFSAIVDKPLGVSLATQNGYREVTLPYTVKRFKVEGIELFGGVNLPYDFLGQAENPFPSSLIDPKATTAERRVGFRQLMAKVRNFQGQKGS